jgi:nitroreductase
MADVITSDIEAIRLRTSVRSYQDREIDQTAFRLLQDFVTEPQTGPFGNKVQFALISSKKAERSPAKRLGTYGVIRGATWYLAATVASLPHAMEDFGYCMEEALLFCTKLGLGTCWLGGSLNRSGFAVAAGLGQGEVLPGVVSIGYAAERRSLIDRTVRTFAGSKNRKPWGDLFYERDFHHSMPEDPADSYSVIFQCVRTAPSASNKQPWRIVRDANGILNLFIARSKGYGRWFPGIDLQLIDTGIAMCHLSLAARELGINGQWTPAAPATDARHYDYISSWVPSGRIKT